MAKKNNYKPASEEARSGVVERYDEASARFDVLMTRLRYLQDIYDDLAERVARLKVRPSTAVQRPRASRR